MATILVTWSVFAINNCLSKICLSRSNFRQIIVLQDCGRSLPTVSDKYVIKVMMYLT